ncbi:MAG: DUF4080 domain-containing protein, partial [Clostridia bacterium]
MVGVNAKFIHSNLAIRYLARLDRRCAFREYTVSDRAEHIAADLYQTGERVLLFSCYIWNIECVRRVCEILKKADSGLCLSWGGPEVSFDPARQLAENPAVDFVLCGEGEPSLSLFADALTEGGFDRVPGLWYREDGTVKQSREPAREAVMDELPFPYTEADMAALRNRIVYFETARGCPYRCAFCLSGGAGSLRFLSLDRVEQAVDFFARHRVPLVKLVDRTFNADPDRALSIIEAIKRRGGETTYHLEVRAEAMTEPLIQSLQTAPEGMFQLEIGVQSTNPDTLRGINRSPAFERLAYVVRALSQNRNIHLHLDLIAGLPGESMADFIQSFEQVMALRPHQLQLGFLKKLKGAALRAPGSAFWDFPPYEIVHSDAMSYEELLRLKDAEEMLERYYNSGAFQASVSYILDTYYVGRAFAFFCEIAEFSGTDTAPQGQKALFEILYRFGMERFGDRGIADRLVYDYSLRHRDTLSFMQSGDGLKARAFEFLKKPERVALYFADYAGEKPVTLYKKIRFVPIGRRIFAFDYGKTAAVDVTAEF